MTIEFVPSVRVIPTEVAETLMIGSPFTSVAASKVNTPVNSCPATVKLAGDPLDPRTTLAKSSSIPSSVTLTITFTLPVNSTPGTFTTRELASRVPLTLVGVIVTSELIPEAETSPPRRFILPLATLMVTSVPSSVIVKSPINS